jgi:hypothetical protein
VFAIEICNRGWHAGGVEEITKISDP